MILRLKEGGDDMCSSWGHMVDEEVVGPRGLT